MSARNLAVWPSNLWKLRTGDERHQLVQAQALRFVPDVDAGKSYRADSVHSKAVVFSDWRKTLDLAARALDFCAILYVRYDGTITERDRLAALSRFSNDAEAKTACTSMEPQWNPTVEDQAFARVHRMGQKRPVTAIRFVVADSYEQQVVMLQGRKKTFADMALSPKKSPSSGRGSFDHLKALLA